MQTYTCSVPGVGSTKPDAQPTTSRVSSVYMSGNWTFHAYNRSYDGKANVIHRPDGIVVDYSGKQTFLEMDIIHNNPREFRFHPDSRRVAFWAPFEGEITHRRIAMLDMSKLGGNRPWEIIYDPLEVWKTSGEEHIPFGMEWSPKGNALYVIERVYPENKAVQDRTQIVRLAVPGYRPTVLVDMTGVIDFFMPPVSRFENGQGPTNRGYWIALGHPDGLFLLDPTGAPPKNLRRISNLPAVGLHNIEWHPGGKDQLLLFFRRPTVGGGQRVFQGVWLVHLDRIGKEDAMGDPFEQLYTETDVHTLWYSPKGTYITWATPTELAFRRPEDPADATVYLDAKAENGQYLDVKGASWHASERYLAFTAGNRLFVHDVQAKTTRQLLAMPGDEASSFAAEPVWVGDQIYLSVFEDITEEVRSKVNRPTFGHE